MWLTLQKSLEVTRWDVWNLSKNSRFSISNWCSSNFSTIKIYKIFQLCPSFKCGNGPKPLNGFLMFGWSWEALWCQGVLFDFHIDLTSRSVASSRRYQQTLNPQNKTTGNLPSHIILQPKIWNPGQPEKKRDSRSLIVVSGSGLHPLFFPGEQKTWTVVPCLFCRL